MFKPGEKPSTNKLNYLVTETQRAGRSVIGEGSSGSYGSVSAVPENPNFYAKITAKGILENVGGYDPYSFVEVYKYGEEWLVKDGGLTCDYDVCPLYELNNNTLTNGQVVIAWKGHGDFYLCDSSSGGCGVTAVYCQGNQLVVVYSTPIVPAALGDWFCTQVISVLPPEGCAPTPVGSKYCKQWPANLTAGATRDALCPTGTAVITETIISGPYVTQEACIGACTTTTTPAP